MRLRTPGDSHAGESCGSHIHRSLIGITNSRAPGASIAPFVSSATWMVENLGDAWWRNREEVLETVYWHETMLENLPNIAEAKVNVQATMFQMSSPGQYCNGVFKWSKSFM